MLLCTSGGGDHKLVAPFICKGFKWTFQQTEFTADVLVLPLGSYDLILGVQWLRSLGPTLWDFDKLQMEFHIDGKKFILRGAKTPQVKLVNNKSFARAVQQGAEMCFKNLDQTEPQFFIPTCNLLHTTEVIPELPAQISQLLIEFYDIFEEPTTLPPSRLGFDHRIPLKDKAPPVNLRPYRYSIVQKDIVDKLVKELLDQGVIQHGNNPYASPTVLVRKKDGSRRLCVDYRKA